MDHCSSCGRAFAVPALETDSFLDGENRRRRERSAHCPYCGGTSWTAAEPCAVCGGWKDSADSLCPDCCQRLRRRAEGFLDELCQEEVEQLDHWLEGRSLMDFRGEEGGSCGEATSRTARRC